MPQRTQNMGVNLFFPSLHSPGDWLSYSHRELWADFPLSWTCIRWIINSETIGFQFGLWWVKSASANFKPALHHLKSELKSDYVLFKRLRREKKKNIPGVHGFWRDFWMCGLKCQHGLSDFGFLGPKLFLCHDVKGTISACLCFIFSH